MPGLRVTTLEYLFTANTTDIERAEKSAKAMKQRVEGKPIEIGADTKDALAGMDRVEKAAKKLVSQNTAVTVNANIEKGEKSLDRVQKRLDYLRSVESTVDVKAQVGKAEAELQRIQRSVDALKSARAEMVVDVNEGGARKQLADVANYAEKSLKKAGDAGGRELTSSLDSATRGAGEKVGAVVGGDIESTLIDALAAIPIAGGIILAGKAIGDAVVGAIQDGMAVDVGNDRLQALTGISAADALRLGRAAGEAYANNVGSSIEQNMDTTRLALQFRILDSDSTTRDAQRVVQGLAGISGVLEEDVRPTAAAVATMLSSGLASSAQQAFDIIAAGARNGVNRNEDLLDTLTEYPALFKRLGLTGEEALGLVSQGMKAGARNSDLAADALKEFQIRATDASESSAQGFELIGLNAEDMTAKIAAGGLSARKGLGEVLDGLRAIEDPVTRNAAAVALFGTQAEDLGEALFAMDLSTAVEQLDGVTGSAQKMFDTLADNDASKVQEAQRNIEVAVSGIQGALAAAFSEPLGDFADWVSENRGPLMEFLLSLANGALDFGRSTVEAAAVGTEAFGTFVSGPLADIVEGFKHVVKVINPFADTSDLENFINGMRDFDTTADTAAQTMRDSLIPGIDEAQKRLNEFADPVVALAYVNDAARRTADAVAAVGYAADGATPLVDAFNLSQDGTVTASSLLEQQVQNTMAALQSEIDAMVASGASQDDMSNRISGATQALADQLTQMGLTEQAAYDLINAGGTVVIDSDTSAAKQGIDKLVDENNGRVVRIRVAADGESVRIGSLTATMLAQGSIVEFMANGGLRGSRMAPIAQVVPPATYRVVGDRHDVPESYIPLDGSARSIAILTETIRRMPGFRMMADGGVLAPRVSGGTSVNVGDIQVSNGTDVDALRMLIIQLVRDYFDDQDRKFNRGGL